MSRAEMAFEQVYYALRQADGRESWKALKSEAVAFNTRLRSECGIPQAGAADQTQPPGAAQCYIRVTGQQRDEWLSRLTGPAHDEAARSLQEHIALQRQLADLGFLSADTPADGVYGEATRRAISRWQRAANVPDPDGFISNAQVSELMRSSRAISSADPTPGSALFRTNETVWACANPRATRAINDPANPRANDPTWREFVRTDGHCFEVPPDQRWEEIAVRDDLELLRRTPPVVGEPPLFFRARDVAEIPPAEPVQQAATGTPDDAPAGASAAPPPVDATEPTASPELSSAPATVPQTEAPAPVVEQSAASGSSAGVGIGFLLVLVLFAVGVGFVLRERKRAADRRHQSALDIATAEITAQQQPLRVRRLQLVTADAYGTLDFSRWEKEKVHFLQTRILPLIASAGLNEEWPLIAAEVQHRIELAAVSAIEPVGAGYVSDPTVFDPRMTPSDYELHCALLLRSAGWDAHTTVASGDQGTDVLARRNGALLVVQCKLYTRPVDNAAVQQVSAARLHEQARYAAVVSNATYTASARQLARTNGVWLLHHEELPSFDPARRSP